MKISLEEVAATAELARLSLPPEELERARRELDDILGYVERLQAVDVTGVRARGDAGEAPRAASLRADEVGAQLGAEAALASAARRDGSYFDVPRIIAHDKEAG